MLQICWLRVCHWQQALSRLTEPAAIFGDLRFGGADGRAGVLVKSAEHGCDEMIPIR
jgi:hypothetical protein